MLHLKSIDIKNTVKKILKKNFGVVLGQDRLRGKIARKYLHGDGIEIGALHSPLDVPSNAKVKYVDRMSTSNLRKQYPELDSLDLVNVDIIDNGEQLSSITDQSMDFAIANHMIEHCQDPIRTIEQHLRVIRPGGILYMAVPDKRYTFDMPRPLTSLDHVVNDYHSGASSSFRSHFEEWVILVENQPNENREARINNLIEMDYSIHFHVWTKEKFVELLNYCKLHLLFSFEIEVCLDNRKEFIVILRKT